MKKIFVLLCFVSVHRAAEAQFVHHPATVSYLTAAPLSPRFADPFSASVLPAVIPLLEGFRAGVYLEKRFLVKSLNLVQAVAAYNIGEAGVGGRLHYFGTPEFHHLSATLSYARSLGSVCLGTSFSIEHLSEPGFFSEWLLEVQLSTLCKVANDFWLGVSLTNPQAFQLISKKEIRPRVAYGITAGYQVSNKVYGAVTCNKTEGVPLDFNGSMQYNFSEGLTVRLGVSSLNGQPFAGAGWQWKALRIDLAFNFHSELGASPGVLLLLQQPHQTDME